jgi:two-component system chemotaxis response regulator CheY
MSELGDIDFSMPVLIVDDFSTMRRIIKTSLNQIGFSNIIEADDGKNALAKLQSQPVKLIISDWNMPNMMGIDLLRACKADANLKDIPFVMVTAEGCKDNVLEAVKNGVANYIVKPFTAETLQQKLKGVFKPKPAQ